VAELLTKAKPTGKVSITLAPVAVLGPRFFTPMVNITLLPIVGVKLFRVLVTFKSVGSATTAELTAPVIVGPVEPPQLFLILTALYVLYTYNLMYKVSPEVTMPTPDRLIDFAAQLPLIVPVDEE